VIQYYLEKNIIPTQNDLNIKDPSLLEKKWNIFVTLYKNGNIVWNSGNIVELEKNIVNELIQNTIYALWDQRFPDLTIKDIKNLKVRVDIFKNRILIWWKTITDKNWLSSPNPNFKEIKDINPITSGLLVIKKDYTKLSIILPNISSTLTSWKDIETILSNKLEEEFVENNFLIYEIQTNVATNY
jgi:AMMECR1 domain-containing protein